MRFAALLLLAGCASVVPYTRTPRPCQDAAVALVWHEVFDRGDRPPDLWWVPPAAQNCGKPLADGSRGFKDRGGICVAESAWPGGMDLVWLGAWERSGMAHGMAHVAQARDGWPADYNHTTADFRPGGRVAVANARLAAAKLCAP